MAEVILLPGPPIDRSGSRRSPFIEPAPLVEVLFDQLEYLVAHAGQGCSSRMSGLRQARTSPKTAADAVRFAQHASSTGAGCGVKSAGPKRGEQAGRYLPISGLNAASR